MTGMEGAAGRPVCVRCRRPVVACYCEHIPTLPTRTRVLILQHPRESRMPIGTAHMAHLGLPNSILRVGVDFVNDPVLNEVLAAKTPAYLLFPGPSAIDIRAVPTDPSPTLIVVDGTWSHAGKLVRVNPALAALPRVAFIPARPSEYRIRREPTLTCVSTIEALSNVLNVLEGGSSFDALLDPFRNMVDKQIQFATAARVSRRRARLRRPKRTPLKELFAATWSRIVCVQGEANGWSIRNPNRLPPETIHFAACRIATGETYEAVVAPRRPIAPLAPTYVELSEDVLRRGMTCEAWHASWSWFSRPGDLLVRWGTFHTDLAESEGLILPDERLDLRRELVETMQLSGGTLDTWLERLGGVQEEVSVAGRAGRRLGELVGLVRAISTRQEKLRPTMRRAS